MIVPLVIALLILAGRSLQIGDVILDCSTGVNVGKSALTDEQCKLYCSSLERSGIPPISYKVEHIAIFADCVYDSTLALDCQPVIFKGSPPVAFITVPSDVQTHYGILPAIHTWDEVTHIDLELYFSEKDMNSSATCSSRCDPKSTILESTVYNPKSIKRFDTVSFSIPNIQLTNKGAITEPFKRELKSLTVEKECCFFKCVTHLNIRLSLNRLIGCQAFSKSPEMCKKAGCYYCDVDNENARNALCQPTSDFCPLLWANMYKSEDYRVTEPV